MIAAERREGDLFKTFLVYDFLACFRLCLRVSRVCEEIREGTAHGALEILFPKNNNRLRLLETVQTFPMLASRRVAGVSTTRPCVNYTCFHARRHVHNTPPSPFSLDFSKEVVEAVASAAQHSKPKEQQFRPSSMKKRRVEQLLNTVDLRVNARIQQQQMQAKPSNIFSKNIQSLMDAKARTKQAEQEKKQKSEVGRKGEIGTKSKPKLKSKPKSAPVKPPPRDKKKVAQQSPTSQPSTSKSSTSKSSTSGKSTKAKETKSKKTAVEGKVWWESGFGEDSEHTHNSFVNMVIYLG